MPTVKINQLPNFFCQQYFESRLYTHLSRKSYYENSPSKYFFSYEPLHARKRRIFFYQRATYKGTYVEAVEFAKEGEKVAPAKARFRVPFTKKISFLVHKYLGSERPISFEYRLLRDLVYQEAMCKGSSGNGLPYAARAVP